MIPLLCFELLFVFNRTRADVDADLQQSFVDHQSFPEGEFRSLDGAEDHATRNNSFGAASASFSSVHHEQRAAGHHEQRAGSGTTSPFRQERSSAPFISGQPPSRTGGFYSQTSSPADRDQTRRPARALFRDVGGVASMPDLVSYDDMVSFHSSDGRRILLKERNNFGQRGREQESWSPTGSDPVKNGAGHREAVLHTNGGGGAPPALRGASPPDVNVPRTQGSLVQQSASSSSLSSVPPAHGPASSSQQPFVPVGALPSFDSDRSGQPTTAGHDVRTTTPAGGGTNQTITMTIVDEHGRTRVFDSTFSEEDGRLAKDEEDEHSGVSVSIPNSPSPKRRSRGKRALPEGTTNKHLALPVADKHVGGGNGGQNQGGGGPLRRMVEDGARKSEIVREVLSPMPPSRRHMYGISGGSTLAARGPQDRKRSDDSDTVE